MNECVKNTLAAICLVAMSWGALALALNTPICYTSRSTGKYIGCAGVEDKVVPFGSFDRYETFWAPMGVETTEDLHAWMAGEKKE